MKNILIIGATGSIGNAVRQMFLRKTDAQLTLFSRRVNRLKLNTSREKAISGSVTDDTELALAVKSQDFVFVALSGDMKTFAEHIVKVMDQENVQRLVFITTMGIYQEIPSWLGDSPEPYSNSILRPFREAADLIEQSDLNYTIVRPGWYTNGPVNYEITQKGEPFGGHDVSRNSIADYVVKLSENNTLDNRSSVGINEG
ncbi:oxidoreductase [Companilactobacillus paralimentarius DSM 13238 = JCM 10415]|jgi:NmrA-like family.|uniref:Oxidoreductase n=1 Tax=Companilactobacillus paralimentarius DSM 13238 = JCM 10415 TaxID=1122151 RepID=A0A0R1PPJ1_9LACO|nr:NAD(P)H-binding protein [Companilactobacillus paralimentarius]KAE9565035.1 NAD(P)-dependent oxidoreductase [Companilactobacillus paralimentarius]KRL30963.1 oxidoreductase [Companilactobacillus paralimentarius DSM 13238 = JCM 10415]MDR4933983.1 NAD(P)H-binding protein [Companilactobacillus paralimentarius]QFR70383.1 NAD(P)H-binding protein [Companilactobacillus paralimentarius]